MKEYEIKLTLHEVINLLLTIEEFRVMTPPVIHDKRFDNGLEDVCCKLEKILE